MMKRFQKWSVFCLAVLIAMLCSQNVEAQPPVNVVVHSDLVFAEVDGQRLQLDLHIPVTEENSQPGEERARDATDGQSTETQAKVEQSATKVRDSPPLVVWIHGGGWRAGSRRNPKLRQLTQHGFAVASISYRFTDKAIFPAQIHDCKAAVRWLRANAKQYGYNASWIAVAGSSAGGHLALLMGVSGGVQTLEGDVGGNPDQSSTVQAVIDYYGPSDFVLRGKTQPDRAYTTKSGSFALLGGVRDGRVSAEMEAIASPSHYVSSDDPPLLIFQGAQDKTVLPDQSEHIAALYQKTGLPVDLVILPQAKHGGQTFFEGEHFQTALRFLQTHVVD